MREKLTAWLRAEMDDVETLRRQGVLRFALRGTLKNVLVANAINVSLHVALDRAGLLAYPLEPALVVAVSSATLITFAISIIVYSMIGHSILALAIQRDEFRRLSSHDQLSGLLNRRAFFERLEAPGHAGRLVLLDIDHFKAINDEHGHPVGDEVIRRVGGTLAALFRETDAAIGRIGGEEFAILFSHRAVAAHGDPMEAARLAISGMSVPGLSHPVTVSLGVAEVSPERSSVETYLAADRALYLAKAAGRNRTVREDELSILAPASRPAPALRPDSAPFGLTASPSA